MTTKEDRDRAWETDHVSRSEMMELMVPIVQAVSTISSNMTILAKACVHSSNSELAKAGMDALEGSDKAMQELIGFKEKFDEVSRLYDADDGGDDGSSS